MFRQIAGAGFPDTPAERQKYAANAEALFGLHPLELTAALELAWAHQDPSLPLGHPGRRSDLDAIPPHILRLLLVPTGGPSRTPISFLGAGIRWEHLIYAFLIENTEAFEIFQKVVQLYVQGKLEDKSIKSASRKWLRATEELFYKAPPQFTIPAVASQARPDLRAIRRNAYWRMFGMDLIHGEGGDGRPYPYERPPVANTDFRETWRRFLTEVWVGIANESNSSGPKETDDAALLDLIGKLGDMLMTRRREGQLAREEFQAVSMMSWFHLTLEYDSSIVSDLGANATSPDERLVRVANAVGMQMGGKKEKLDSLFDLAEPMSSLLILIEQGSFNETNVATLYRPGALEQDMRRIIRAWSASTGDNIKGVTITARAAAPALVPA